MEPVVNQDTCCSPMKNSEKNYVAGQYSENGNYDICTISGNTNNTNNNITVTDNYKEPISSAPHKDEGDGGGGGGETTKFSYCCNCAVKCHAFLTKMRLRMLDGIEGTFYRLGCFAGKNPHVFIITGFLISLLSIGMLLRVESDKQDDWIPLSQKIYNQQYRWGKLWMEKQQTMKDRLMTDKVIAICVDDEILTPEGLLKMYELHEIVLSINVTGMNIKNYCKWNICRLDSLLKLWEYDERKIKNLTHDQILQDVDNYTKFHRDIEMFLSNIHRNEAGYIMGAGVAKMTWRYIYNNNAWNWQRKFSGMFSSNPTRFKELYTYTYYDFIEHGTAFKEDIMFVLIGYSIMGIYIIICLGRCNLLDQKIGLAFVGIMCIGIGYFTTLGIGGLLNINYGILNRVLALLLLGIGIDDMFVILGALNNLSALEKDRPVHEQIGLIMKHAGVSITITTLSDIIAFAIGATSAFPGLRTFCLYNCIGILLIYLMQITFFASCVSIDLRRILDNRDGLFCCYKHTDYTPNECSKKDLLSTVFSTFATKILCRKPVKAAVILVTLIMVGFCSWNISQLQTNNNWQRVMYPTNSHYYRYFINNEKYFLLHEVGVYCKDIRYVEHMDALEAMSNDLSQSPYIQPNYTVDWLSAFLEWNRTSKFNSTFNYFEELMDRFWLSPKGKPYHWFIERQIKYTCLSLVKKSYICPPTLCESSMFPSPLDIKNCKVTLNTSFFVSSCNCYENYMLNCNCKSGKCIDGNTTNNSPINYKTSCNPLDHSTCSMASRIIYYNKMNCSKRRISFPVTKISMRMIKVTRNFQKMNIMKDLEDRVAKYFNRSSCFVLSENYLQWRINEILEWEIKKNLCLAFVSVFVITTIVIMNCMTSLMVVLSVIFTLVDVGGFIYIWGLYIDTTSCVILTIAVGLVVDYSVHIGFTFMTLKGKSNDRMIITMKEIGPPVFHGGFSTLIAVVPLSMSSTYPFKAFFKIFLLVVIFGLFHGIVFLPVILSIFAPSAYSSAKDITIKKTKKNHKSNAPKLSGITHTGLDLDNESLSLQLDMVTQTPNGSTYNTDCNTEYLHKRVPSTEIRPSEISIFTIQNGAKPVKDQESR